MAKQKKIPLRICIGCREKRPKVELVRIVRTPENEIILDSTGKKPGRGAYICPLEDCFTKAVKGKRLERNLQLPVPADLISEIAETLKQKESEL